MTVENPEIRPLLTALLIHYSSLGPLESLMSIFIIYISLRTLIGVGKHEGYNGWVVMSYLFPNQLLNSEHDNLVP